MRTPILAALLLLSGCFVGDEAHEERLLDFDLDGDGVAGVAFGGEDCDDDDPLAGGLTSSEEVCDGRDNNCDGETDEGMLESGAIDEDDDGFGVGEASIICRNLPNFVPDGGDCDDTNEFVHPDASDDCDNIDNDCDGIVDNDIATVWFIDSDGDGWGDAGTEFWGCLQPDGYVDNDGDCDDTDSAVSPSADELCVTAGVDDDCSGTADTGAVDNGLAWLDDDDDGWGDGAAVEYCGPVPTDHVTQFGDCDDTDVDINPDADDLCDSEGIDDDCNGIVNDGSDGTWYSDLDGDTYGSETFILLQCTPPGPDWSSTKDDCDDDVFFVNPGVDESCNGVDDDCNGTIDDNPPTVLWWADTDSDGFGDAGAPSNLCEPGEGFVQNTSDCDDSSAAVNPLAVETCADVGVDNDCDSDAAEEGLVLPTWYADTDGDGYGDIGTASAPTCSPPLDYVADNSDCDDGEAAVNPGEIEVCNGFDDDCNGDADSDATDRTTHYVDLDLDGYGSTTEIEACDDTPAGISATDDDCDDDEITIHPNADETCNSIDDDCDLAVDEDAISVNWYRDSDDDGYGDTSDTRFQCAQPNNFVLTPGDCDDGEVAINPAMLEMCSTPEDDNCDGSINEDTADDAASWYADSDGDGYGAVGATAELACTAPAGTSATDDDCDDSGTGFGINPAADELCSSTGVDDNCDGLVDDPTATDTTNWYLDNDGDDFGDASGTPSAKCTGSGIEVEDNTDCNDGAASVNPDAGELCATVGVDDNCDGTPDDASAADGSLWNVDADGDGVGLASEGTTSACTAPPGYSGADFDCDNDDNRVFPGNTEIPYNDLDDDCVGGDECDVDGDLEGSGIGVCGGTDCDDTDPLIQVCVGFPYVPPNADPEDYTEDLAIDFSLCTGDDLWFNSDDGSYSPDWQSCTTDPVAEIVPLTSGQNAYVIPTEGWNQPSGADVVITGNKPVIVLVYGDASVGGIIDAGAVDYTTDGPGGDGPNCSASQGGDGLRGGAADDEDNHGASGGGGAGSGQAGAVGGIGDDETTVGTAGAALTSAGVDPLHGGCNGGIGRKGHRKAPARDADGGRGGGAFQMSVEGDLAMTGTIWAGGGGGQGAYGVEASGAGGGSGGAVLLQGDTVSVSGDISANGGGGGGGGAHGVSAAEVGEDGEDGSQLTTALGGDGGLKGGENGGDAGDGGAATGGPTAGGMSTNKGGGGGGGGGAGFIYINGATSCSVSGADLSPSHTGNCI